MPLGMEVGLGPGDIALDGDPAVPHRKGGSQQPPTFRRMSIVTKRSPISATAELLLICSVDNTGMTNRTVVFSSAVMVHHCG